jgi:serine/threonine protein kinase
VELIKVPSEKIVNHHSQMLLRYFKESYLYRSSNPSLENLIYIRDLGESSIGYVSLVKCKFTHIYFACKSISKLRIKEESLINVLRREYETSKNLDFQFLGKVIKTIQTKTHVIFFKEFINGCELFVAMNEIGIFNKYISQFYFVSILFAIDYLHQNEIIYRDVKPENVIISNNVSRLYINYINLYKLKGYIKLIDFSTIKKIENKTYTIIGTPNYISYEVIMGEGYSFSADYWSLGICLYEFYIGYVPFGNGDDDPYKIYTSIIDDDVKFPKYLKDKDFIDLITKMIEKDPAKRYSNRDLILNHRWFEKFDYLKLLKMSLPSPYIPIPKNSIKLKTISYKDFLSKNSNFEYIPLDEDKTDDEVWYDFFDI